MLLNNIIDEKLGRAWQHKTCHTIDEHQRQTCQEKAASWPNQIPKIAIDMRGVELLLWLLVVSAFLLSAFLLSFCSVLAALPASLESANAGITVRVRTTAKANTTQLLRIMTI